MTDDYRSAEGEGDVAIVDSAIGFAQQMLKAFSARRSRPLSEAERAAILREAFLYAAADAAPNELRKAL